MDILSSLNKEQLEAVKTTEGFVRVIAGAGSGKTRALTSRYAYIHNELDIPTTRILSVTFTNKAANEMKTRITKMLGTSVAAPFIMTFHGFCNRVLREDIDKLGYPLKFKILDTEDQADLLKPIYDELGITNKDYPYKKALSDLIGKGCKQGSRSIVPEYEKLLVNYTSAEINDLIEMMPTIENKIIMGYLREQKKDFCLDYDDLLNFVIYLFKTNKDVREKWQEHFDYIQVDEFQDVSMREFELVAILSQKNKNLFVVGDSDQTIYSFKGSDIRCIIDFQPILESIQGEPCPVKTIQLNTNYRSTPEILSVSNSLIKHNVERIDKELVTPNNCGARVLHYHAKNIYQEAEWVAKRILSLNRTFSDFAILFRNNASSRVLEEKLVSYRIPYEMLSGLSFYQRKEVKDVLAVLNVIAFDDNISFRRIIKNNPLKIGNKKMEFLTSVSDTRGISLYQALKENYKDKMFKSTQAEFLVNLIEHLRAQSTVKSIAQLIDMIIVAFEYEETYTKADEIERYENLIELKNSAKHFEYQEGEKVDLADYLGTLALYSETDKEESKDKVKLMTVHAAKGLEYPVVFLVGMNEGLMPSSRTATAADLEEERRIAYVAMTRAEEMLFLTDAEGENYDRSMRLPSRFIFNIERDLFNTEGVMDRNLLWMSQDYIKKSEERLKPSSKLDLSGYNLKNLDTLKQGDRVIHETFGEGIIAREDADAFVIMFDSGEMKGIVKSSKKLSKK